MFSSLFGLARSSISGSAHSHKRSRRRGRQSEHALSNWIWLTEDVPERNCYAQFRKTLWLSTSPKSATVLVTAQSKYKLFVNGRYVGRGPARAPEGVFYYDAHDVSQFLEQGANVIAFLVHYFGVDTYMGLAGKPGLNCKVEVELEDQKLEVITDETWLVRRAEEWSNKGARINEFLGFQEVYESGLRVDDWNSVNCSEEGWRSPSIVNIEGRLLPRPIPLLEESTALPESVVGVFNSPARDKDVAPSELANLIASSPLSELVLGSVSNPEALLHKRGSMWVRTPRGNVGVVVILDFGREVFGELEIGISRCSRGYIDVAYSEVLEEGRVQPDRGGACYVDRIVLSKGPIAWQGFEPRAFRYVQLEFRWLGRGAAIEYVRVNRVGYPVRQVATFGCSDSILNTIWRTSSYTTQLCMEDSFIASPSFDRMLNWTDVHVQARAAYYAFGDTMLLAKALRDVAESQATDGRLTGISRSNPGKEPGDLMLLWVISVLDYYAFSGDLTLVRELYPRVRRLMKWFDKFVGSDGLVENMPVGLMPGGSAANGCPVEQSTALNALFCHALQVAGALADLFGNRSDAEHFNSRAHELKLAINKVFYVPEKAMYASGRVQGKLVEEYDLLANVFAALFDIADHYRKSAILRKISSTALSSVETPVEACYLLYGLYAHEMHDVALDLIREKWGDMLQHGATTFWERFDGLCPRCRGWSVCPTSDLIAEYVGIKASLATSRFSIVPHVADLKWARGSVSTPSGPLAVEWRANKTRLTVRVDVPIGVKADVCVPADLNSQVVLDGKPQAGKFMTIGAGTHVIVVTAPRRTSQSKIPKGQEPTPQPQVEILGELYAKRVRASAAKLGKEQPAKKHSRRTRTRRTRDEEAQY